MNITIHTLGCKVNQYESQAIRSTLHQVGFTDTPPDESADVILINSCTVTAVSDAKVRNLFRRSKAQNPHAVMVLTGCMPQAFPEKIAKSFPDADIILGTKNRRALPEHILRYLSTRQQIIDIQPHEASEAFEPMSIDRFQERSRAFVKIQDGCNRFCSYCIIPYARGRVRSKPLGQLLTEITALGKKGYREVVLTGINLSAYGQEMGLSLCDAVEAVCGIADIARVRLGSLEPEGFSPEVIRRLAAQKKLCPQFHLSLQSGCDATLRRMNRHYTAAQYRAIVEALRAAFENAAITTDIMVGFPGETPEEFQASLAFAQEIRFARTHVFAYSRRPGTKAYDAPGQLSKECKIQRSHAMQAVAQASREAFFAAQMGRVEEILLEQKAVPSKTDQPTQTAKETARTDGPRRTADPAQAADRRPQEAAVPETAPLMPKADCPSPAFVCYNGYTMNYSPVQVRLPCATEAFQGKIVSAKLSAYNSDHCFGALIEESQDKST